MLILCVFSMDGTGYPTHGFILCEHFYDMGLDFGVGLEYYMFALLQRKMNWNINFSTK